jgi:hypothetical protein
MSLADFLISPRQQRLLTALLLHPERSYGYNELIRIAGKGRGANQNVLHGLLSSGVVIADCVGNQHRIRANSDFPLYPELRSICIKTFGVRECLLEGLSPLRDKIEFAFMFGLAANAKNYPDSKTNVMIVGSVDLVEIKEALEPIERASGQIFNVNVFSNKEWQTQRFNTNIYRILTGPKLMVIGEDPAPRSAGLRIQIN